MSPDNASLRAVEPKSHGHHLRGVTLVLGAEFLLLDTGLTLVLCTEFLLPGSLHSLSGLPG